MTPTNAPLVGFGGTRVLLLRAITEYNLMIKFPTEYGIRELRGDQVAARECYIAMLEMEDHQQTICIGEQRTMAKSVEELEEVVLDESRLGRTDRKSVV